MNARTLCLAILNFQEATGYEIRKLSMEGQFSHFVDASYGAIYPALTKLEQDGLVESRDEITPGKPARKVYSITPAGRASFIGSLTDFPQPDVFKSEFLLVAMCAEHQDPGHITKVIDLRIADLTAKLGEMENCREAASNCGGRWVLDYGMAVYRASLAYLHENRQRLINIAEGSATMTDAAE